MTKCVFGLAKNEEHAQRIVERLLENSFTANEISVLFAESCGTVREGSIAGQRGQISFHRQSKCTLGHEKHTKAPEGGVTGAAAGGIIGGAIGLLAGLGVLAIPGLGPFIAAGPIVALFSGAGVGGSLGLIIGALAGLGIPEYEAKKYEDSLKTGNVLVCVHVENSERADNAMDILKRENATDIATSREKAGTYNR